MTDRAEPATDALSRARYFVALGFSVFAVPPPRPGAAPNSIGDGKTPATPWREWQTRQPTDAELVAMFSGAPMNVAIVTGEISGVVVVDLDSRDAILWGVRRLTYTPWQSRTARGVHLFYGHPGSRVPNSSKLETPAGGRLAVDVRGDGGYVIAAGSCHASGAAYRFAGDWTAPRADVPTFWPGWLARPERRPTLRPALRTITTGDVIERARRYLAAIPRPEIGNGSDVATLAAACRLVRGFGLDSREAEALLWDWAGGRHGWTRNWIAKKVHHAARYGTEPIGALR